MQDSTLRHKHHTTTGMRLVVFTPETSAANELHTVNRLLDAGLHTLHVRKPRSSETELRQYLNGVAHCHRQRLVLHQHHHLAADLGLKGIHWRKGDRPAPPLPHLPGLTQSTGFHALSDLAEPWEHLDYAFLSPIYDSISKLGYQATAFSRQQLKEALAACSMPVYALGGVTPAVCSDLHIMGFTGCAVIGSVWSAPDPEEAYLRLEEACRRTCRPTDNAVSECEH